MLTNLLKLVECWEFYSVSKASTNPSALYASWIRFHQKKKGHSLSSLKEYPFCDPQVRFSNFFYEDLKGSQSIVLYVEKEGLFRYLIPLSVTHLILVIISCRKKCMISSLNEIHVEPIDK